MAICTDCGDRPSRSLSDLCTLCTELRDIEELQELQLIPRPSIMIAAERMEERLKENDNKGGWNDTSLYYLQWKMYQKLKFFDKAIRDNLDPETVNKLAADIQNYVMMIAENHERGIPLDDEQ